MFICSAFGISKEFWLFVKFLSTKLYLYDLSIFFASFFPFSFSSFFFLSFFFSNLEQSFIVSGRTTYSDGFIPIT